MIVTTLDDHYELITQNDHAHLAAELLGLFRRPELIEHPRREAILLAVREHDSGWRGPDAAPRPGNAGEPIGFREVAAEERRELWSETCRLAKAHPPDVALLITLHAIHLHEDREALAGWGDWLGSLRESRDELLETAEVERASAERDYAWLRLADTCSLMLCGGRSSDFVDGGHEDGGFEGGDFEGAVEEVSHREESRRTLRLRPFPLAGATRFRVACRRIERRPYATARELGQALTRARWSHRTVAVAPLGA